ncbi:acyl-CoA carboxylase epsilon subunit [Actinokineospora xionganensis]|uniref:acyl-CoA carboxylase epsilon subunit n=1 Tax=Actinokineospora xionganensis TaxID=2684470 RepID=UPI0028B258FA|nr:acyl-CoA carboxylase epsilon subunit [Actinokineospora xionganensis]
MSDQPLLRIVRGTPDDVELAALTAVVAVAASASGEEETETSSAWSAKTTLVRRQLDHGPGAWRASGLPR